MRKNKRSQKRDVIKEHTSTELEQAKTPSPGKRKRRFAQEISRDDLNTPPKPKKETKTEKEEEKVNEINFFFCLQKLSTLRENARNPGAGRLPTGFLGCSRGFFGFLKKSSIFRDIATSSSPLRGVVTANFAVTRPEKTRCKSPRTPETRSGRLPNGFGWFGATF